MGGHGGATPEDDGDTEVGVKPLKRRHLHMAPLIVKFTDLQGISPTQSGPA
jgi:hypothetical protein